MLILKRQSFVMKFIFFQWRTLLLACLLLSLNLGVYAQIEVSVGVGATTLIQPSIPLSAHYWVPRTKQLGIGLEGGYTHSRSFATKGRTGRTAQFGLIRLAPSIIYNFQINSNKKPIVESLFFFVGGSFGLAYVLDGIGEMEYSTSSTNINSSTSNNQINTPYNYNGFFICNSLKTGAKYMFTKKNIGVFVSGEMYQMVRKQSRTNVVNDPPQVWISTFDEYLATLNINVGMVFILNP